MKFFWFILYNYLFVPVLYVVLRIGGIFNQKIRNGIIGRKRVYEDIILNALNINKTKKLVWFHSASLGEFEQAKPIIEKLRSTKNVNILITFFSPSGYENSKKYPHADIISYIPFDTNYNAQRFISIVRPSLAVIMRYDIWPNMINSLYKKRIPVFLVDATMRKNSVRKYPFVKSFHKILFKMFNNILTVSDRDAEQFISFYLDKDKVKAVGDTRFDRVYQRSITAREKKLINPEILEGKKIFIAGSTWEQDEEVLFPAIIKIAGYEQSSLFLIVPHEPTLLHLEKIENEFVRKLKTIRFSHLNNYNGERIIIIDSIGILLTLYTYAHIAYVGGSFKQNIHNVLEAAVYGIPVIFGPRIQNSQEAQKLNEIGAGLIVRNKLEAYRALRKFFADEELRKKTGNIAFNYVKENLGATEKILNEIYKSI